MKLTFWGAAGEVTGSMHLVESGGKRFLLDCGLHQGRRKDADRKNRHLPFDASSIDAVVLSHAHIDHSGNLPTLVQTRLLPGPSTPLRPPSICATGCCATPPISRRRTPSSSTSGAEHRKIQGPGQRPRDAALHHGGRRADAAAVSAGPVPLPADPGAGTDLRALRCRPHSGLFLRGAARSLQRRARAPGVLGRRRAAEPAHHPRPRADAAGRLPDHGEHLRRAPAQERRTTWSTSWPTW